MKRTLPRCHAHAVTTNKRFTAVEGPLKPQSGLIAPARTCENFTACRRVLRYYQWGPTAPRRVKTMRQRVCVAPLALKPYVPGEVSSHYSSLNAVARKQVDAETDRLFGLKTGLRRKLDPYAPSDRVWVRQWLLIRDAVMAIRHYQEVAQRVADRNLRAALDTEV